MASQILTRQALAAAAWLAVGAPAVAPAATPGPSMPAAASSTATSGAPESAATPPSTDETSTTGSDHEDEQARAHLKLGQQAFANGRYPEAEDWFERAFSLRPGFDVAANLAAVEQAQAKHSEAATHYALALRTFPATADLEKKRALGARFQEARSKVGTIHLRIDVEGAEIRVAGKPAGKSPLADPIFVVPGELRIEAEKGARRMDRTIHIGAGEELALALDLGAGWTADDDGRAGPLVAGVGFGLAGAGIVVAIVLTVVADGKTSDARDLQAQYEASGTRCGGGCPELRNAFASADDIWNAASGVWIATGLVAIGAAAATAALFVADDGGNEAGADAVLAPMAGPALGGVSLRGRF